MNAANPLLDLRYPIAFDRIDVAHVVPGVRALIARANTVLEGVKAAVDAPTWANTLGALDAATEPLDRAWTVVEHLKAVTHSDALTEAHGTVLGEVSQFYTSISLDADIYAAVRAFAGTDEAKALTGPRARYLDKTLDGFRRQGAELGAADKATFEAQATELATLGSQFGTNVMQETAAWDLVIDDEAALEGLPDSAKAMAKGLAEQAGVEGWRFTLQHPSVQAVLRHMKDRAVRETVWRAYHQRCTEGERANGPIIARMLALRGKQAALLGYDDFSDYILADRMAKEGAKATDFLADIERQARPAFDRETAELKAFAAEHLGIDDLQPWDVGFAAEHLRKHTLNVDDEALRPYLEFPKVLQGAFDLAERLYGVTIQPADLPVWHDTVSAYEIFDGATHIGGFYVDFEPRPTKRQGAWMNPLITGGPRPDGSFAPHMGLICGNATPPVGDQPALLTHREVETVFHEFGHLLHHLLTTVDIRGLAGTNVAWDFVELPSQIMENWTWSKEALDLFATHVDTGAPIPDDLFDRMLAARNFRAASHIMRQLGFGTTDLALHRELPEDADAVAWGGARMARYAPTPEVEGHSLLPTFLHLFSSPVGYAAGYYSYMWASVLDADAFTKFESKGLFDRETGQAFRTLLLSQGNADDPAVLFRRFMGRDPDPKAMLRRDGILAA